MRTTLSILALAVSAGAATAQEAELFKPPLGVVSPYLVEPAPVLVAPAPSPSARIQALGTVELADDESTFGGELGTSLAIPFDAPVGAQIDALIAGGGLDDRFGVATSAFLLDDDHTIGFTGAFLRAYDTDIVALGPDFSFSVRGISLDAWGGIALDPDGDRSAEPFAALDLSFDPSTDWTLSAGVAYAMDTTSARLAASYHIPGSALSLDTEVRFLEDDVVRIGAGLTGRFGGSDFRPNRVQGLASAL